jgi:hypothetical protein
LLFWNIQRISQSLYELIKAKPDEVGEGTGCLEADIPRTFPHLNEFFEQDVAMSDTLREVLTTFCIFRPEIGYMQGMSYFMGTILLHFGPPHECFKVFCNLLTY